MALPIFRAAASAGAVYPAASLTIAKPAGTIEGDVMVAGVTTNGLAPLDLTGPAGWTLIRSDLYTVAGRQSTWYKVAGAAEPADYVFTPNGNASLSGAIVTFSVVDTGAPVDVHSGAVSNDGLPSIIAPSVTTTAADTMLVGFFGAHDPTVSIAVAAGMTERAHVHPDAFTTIEVATEARAASGATGDRSATANLAGRDVGQMVALRGAVVVGVAATASLTAAVRTEAALSTSARTTAVLSAEPRTVATVSVARRTEP